MNALRFECDERKSRANQRKHGVSLPEARSAFYDEQAKLYFDPDHSESEDRFILVGISFSLRVLIVCHCYRESDLLIRISSAKKADHDEGLEYWRGLS